MINRIALLTALSLTAANAFAAEVSSTEQSVILAANKRSQEIAIARIPVETRYLSVLQQAYKKAEATKDLDLQVKIKKEIEIVETNIAYFKEKSTETNDPLKLTGIKWVSGGGAYWFKLSGGKYTNYAGENSPYEIKDNKIYIKGNVIQVLHLDEGFIMSTNGNDKFLPEGKTPKLPKKAPEGEEVNTVFGRRVK